MSHAWCMACDHPRSTQPVSLQFCFWFGATPHHWLVDNCGWQGCCPLFDDLKPKLEKWQLVSHHCSCHHPQTKRKQANKRSIRQSAKKRRRRLQQRRQRRISNETINKTIESNRIELNRIEQNRTKSNKIESKWKKKHCCFGSNNSITKSWANHDVTELRLWMSISLSNTVKLKLKRQAVWGPKPYCYYGSYLKTETFKVS